MHKHDMTLRKPETRLVFCLLFSRCVHQAMFSIGWL